MRGLLTTIGRLCPILFLFCFLEFEEAPVQRQRMFSLQCMYGAQGVPDVTTVADVRRFVQNFRAMKRIIPHYYASFTHRGDLIYFLGLNNIDVSVLEANKRLTQRDMEQHLHFVRQIVWDCIVSVDEEPLMYMVVDLRGLQLMNAWTKKNRILTSLLRSIRDHTFTKRFHRVQVAAISENRVARTIVEMKRHKFPAGTDVQVYPSFDAFINANKHVTRDVLPRSHGGSSDLDLPNEGLEYMISFFVEEILARQPQALYECSKAQKAKSSG
ncbi:hypothetical protein TGPRC2_215160 [Toxoplasma gondii TgCatPRC2]|uniref:CRAL-TRIO domain-containing protein n=14 Tax=Toxoplasma gondii TaxID=5811 RepID=A0A125YPS3_TOXGV|nr:hypothetical protein TGME49_215160 [Toxoplasma gondii ME49]EPR60090.1 hypothetical protein TGGT1_215160 [Toxoplasma gondii GT1]ESS31166.1 hypothetical protein TGVEG_215160 [Toxoplasma gondii VEG]KAF4640021.1 hypothetical protein TGRH88_039460 [Toxoplasma gondii]KFG36048.1 hypothetical protein TGDOM2_215160 [Toxoplasma gondii GAB2-2007-GAL-DOM2]KFG41419.1 hypothetical protein TGP89_215160 [Toxoplasma gondii p89]KFG52873.1 hypothetical protein TGFOU_215160 [Toxoplasma gondii FOU]KFG62187.1 |eukprot:XP_002370835.2 hypothetical protein TGME49_215160 [Toxoplasma gondii ME49]